ncbi:MAG: tetratricopeptide repeat protein [Candidatus Marinarcus sp.]|uniref:tetratricopeptide repeat protein n=1 Tax=Candidatus Marinarcus sp. TaxID=3100987 RepID=UPI003B008B5B
MDSKQPYGLTSTEKHILKNKTELNSIDTKVKDVKNTIESISERIDGLESIYEGDSKKLNGAVLRINELLKKDELHDHDIANIKNVTNQILTIQEENTKTNKTNLDNLKLAIEKLTTLVNTINAQYVSDKELKSNMAQFVTLKEFETFRNKVLNINPQETENKTDLSDEDKKLSNAELLDKAKEYFKKDYFTNAIPIFESLITKNYKPAESNFYLGEIWYYRKQYNDAIVNFKQSAMLYDKASYMPKLLLHSAISFEKVNDLNNAASFYSTLINVYPNSPEARTANKNLINIK